MLLQVFASIASGGTFEDAYPWYKILYQLILLESVSVVFDVAYMVVYFRKSAGCSARRNAVGACIKHTGGIILLYFVQPMHGHGTLFGICKELALIICSSPTATVVHFHMLYEVGVWQIKSMTA